jgi:hypothetical protein
LVSDALENLVHDNYERSYSGSRNREADADLIRAALSRISTPAPIAGEQAAQCETMNNGRDCLHGNQVGKCDTCDLHEAEHENAQLRARVGELTEALTNARDWFESQAKSISKGNGSPFELIQVRDQRDACDAALAQSQQGGVIDACK